MSGLIAITGDPEGAQQKVGVAVTDLYTGLDAEVGSLANQAMNCLATGNAPNRMGKDLSNIVADRYIIIAAANDRQFRALCDVPERPDLATKQAYAQNADRIVHRADFVPELRQATIRWRKANLLPALKTAQAPAAPINTLDEVFAAPQARYRGMAMAPSRSVCVRPALSARANSRSTKAPHGSQKTPNARTQGWHLGGEAPRPGAVKR